MTFPSAYIQYTLSFVLINKCSMLTLETKMIYLKPAKHQFVGTVIVSILACLNKHLTRHNQILGCGHGEQAGQSVHRDDKKRTKTLKNTPSWFPQSFEFCTHLKKWAFVVIDLLNGSEWNPHYGDQWDAPAHQFSPHWVCVLPIVSRSVLDNAGGQYTLCREKDSLKTILHNHHY